MIRIRMDCQTYKIAKAYKEIYCMMQKGSKYTYVYTRESMMWRSLR